MTATVKGALVVDYGLEDEGIALLGGASVPPRPCQVEVRPDGHGTVGVLRQQLVVYQIAHVGELFGRFDLPTTEVGRI